MVNKIERVKAAIKGDAVDRPPFSFWYHFGLQHASGKHHADAEIGFFKAYDLDFLKVMNDYPYPVPNGLRRLQTEEDWKRVEPIKASDKCWTEQLEALSAINDSIGREALFIDTIFSPWTTARRLSGRAGLKEMKKRNPDLVLAAMDSIAGSLALYAQAAIERGASGIFLSVGAASEDVMTPDEYEQFGRPFDLKVLEAVRGARFNVLHIHGRRIHFDNLLDYPANVINWSHFQTSPSLKDGLKRAGKTVMGGIDETEAAHLSSAELIDQVESSLLESGNRGVIIAPGCSVPTDTPVSNLLAIGEAARGLAQK